MAARPARGAQPNGIVPPPTASRLHLSALPTAPGPQGMPGVDQNVEPSEYSATTAMPSGLLVVSEWKGLQLLAKIVLPIPSTPVTLILPRSIEPIKIHLFSSPRVFTYFLYYLFLPPIGYFDSFFGQTFMLTNKFSITI